jgi:hypothetical protein
LAALSFNGSSVAKINGADSSEEFRKSQGFMKLRVAMASTSDTVTLPSDMGAVVDFAYRPVTDTDELLVTLDATGKVFTIASPTQHTVDIWMWFKG